MTKVTTWVDDTLLKRIQRRAADDHYIRQGGWINFDLLMRSLLVRYAEGAVKIPSYDDYTPKDGDECEQKPL
jgi:hypothetical protein